MTVNLYSYPEFRFEGCRVWYGKRAADFIELRGTGYISNWSTGEFVYTFKDLSPIKKVYNNLVARYLYIEKENSKWILNYGESPGDIYLKMTYPIIEQKDIYELIYTADDKK